MHPVYKYIHTHRACMDARLQTLCKYLCVYMTRIYRPVTFLCRVGLK